MPEQELKPLFNQSEINPFYFDQLESADQEQILFGKYSMLQENFEMPDGTLVDGKIRFSRNKGKITMDFQEQKTELILPGVPILGKLLTKSNITDLEKGKTIKIKYRSTILYLKVDKELNKIIISNEKQIGMIKKLGGYTFSEQDKNLWINNQKLPPRIFYNPNSRSYFQSSVRLKQDGKSIEFTGYQPIKNKVNINKLIAKYNSPPLSPLSTITDITNQSLEKKKHLTQDKLIPPIIDISDTAFQTHLENNNLSAIRKMADNGFKPTGEKLNQFLNKAVLSIESKREIIVSLKMDPTKFQKEFLTKENKLVVKNKKVPKKKNLKHINKKGKGMGFPK